MPLAQASSSESTRTPLRLETDKTVGDDQPGWAAGRHGSEGAVGAPNARFRDTDDTHGERMSACVGTGGSFTFTADNSTLRRASQGTVDPQPASRGFRWMSSQTRIGQGVFGA